MGIGNSLFYAYLVYKNENGTWQKVHNSVRDAGL